MMGAANTAAAGALGGFCIMVLIAHRIWGGSQSYDRVNQQGGTVVLGKGMMNAGYWMLQPVVRFCIRVRIGASVISWGSLVPGVFSGVAAALGWWGWAAWGLFVSAMLDVLDGAVARAAKQASPGGAVLDSVLDRYTEFFVFAGIMIFYRDELIPQLLCLTALFGSFLITYSTAKAEALGITPPRGCMKRSDRLTLLVVGSLLAPLLPSAPGVAGDMRAWPVLLAVALISALANGSAVTRFMALKKDAMP